MSSLAYFQEMRRAKGKGLAYSLSWRVMARQEAERKLLMVYTSIFNAFFLFSAEGRYEESLHISGQ